MLYKEARESALNKAALMEWVVKYCEQGPDCWCRDVYVTEPIQFSYLNPNSNEVEEDDVEHLFKADALIAEQIVAQHNKSLSK